MKSCFDIYQKLFEAYGPQHWWPAQTQDEVIIGAVLTQNTAWVNVEKAINNLKKNDLCSLEKIRQYVAAMPTSLSPPSPTLTKQGGQIGLANLIKPSGYFNVKAKRLYNVANEIKPNILYHADIKTARASLLTINGVGKETADSILLYAFDRPIFVIDAYTKRLFSRLGIVLKDYDEYQDYFMKNLPNDVKLFNEYHALIVWHAKYFCKTKPDCVKCCLKAICGAV